MEVIALTCARCDAPIRVQEGQKSVVCEHCETQLLIERKDEGVQTEIVEEILRRTESLAREVKALRAERKLKQLRRLDVRWSAHRRRLARQKDRDQIDDPAAAIIVVTLTAAVGAFAAGFPILGFVFGLFLGVGVYLRIQDNGSADRARQRFRRRRRRLVASIRDATPAE